MLCSRRFCFRSRCGVANLLAAIDDVDQHEEHSDDRDPELLRRARQQQLALSVIDLQADEALPGYRIQATVNIEGKTGVEMEALTAATVAALTLYDMAKAIEKSIEISNIRLLSKTGGKSGDYVAP